MRKKTSILKKMLIPMLLVMAVQFALLYLVVIRGGLLNELQVNAFDIFEGKVTSQRNRLQNDMLQRWSNLESCVLSIQSKTKAFLDAEGKSTEDFAVGDPMTETLLADLSEDLIYLLRRNSVTGAFLVLDGDREDIKSGLYFRDQEPAYSSVDNSDLLAERGPAEVIRSQGIPMDSLWYPTFTFGEDGDDEKAAPYFYGPFMAAREQGSDNYKDFGYWYGPFYLNQDTASDSYPILTYSVPIMDDEGKAYAVLGVEMSTTYLKSTMIQSELSNISQGGYMLAASYQSQEQEDGSLSCSIVMQDGSYLRSLLGDVKELSLKKLEGQANVYTLDCENSMNQTVYANVQMLTLYDSNTPFVKDQWMIIGIISKGELLGFASRFQRLMLMGSLVTFTIGILGIVIVSRKISKPMFTLMTQVRNANPEKNLKLEKLHISEIDELSEAIENLSYRVADESQKLSTILEMVGVSVGAFEYNPALSREVFCTDALFSILHMEELKTESNYVDPADFQKAWHGIRDFLRECSEDGTVYLYEFQSDDKSCWVRMQMHVEGDVFLGVATDVTREILEKHRIEHDRDFDLLTNIYNRRAFYNTAKKLFGEPEKLKTAAMIMIDLDNLKMINDKYGHDYGDEYIREAAATIRRHVNDRMLFARLSGDEFILLIYGYESQDEIWKLCDEIQEALHTAKVYFPDYTNTSISASAGIAWYPMDAPDYERLLRFADFAMYMVKKNGKGRFTEFNIESYNQEAYQLQCQKELDMILEREALEYHFQPIVDAVTGEIFGYEALMRPQTDNIQNPAELLALARVRSQLDQLEILTFFKSMEYFCQLPISGGACCLFLNSIANQCMAKEDWERFEKRYKAYLSRIVIELTEEERSDSDYTNTKRNITKQWGGGIALDDFGVGYNGETVLLETVPDYIKVDMSIVRNIDTDPDRLHILKNLVSYCKARNIRVIAEGVETRAEMEALIRADIDYLQGFYLAHPAKNPDTQLGRVREEILTIQSQR